MDYHEEYEELRMAVNAEHHTRWQNQLAAMTGEAQVELLEAKRHVSHLAILFVRSRRDGPDTVRDEIIRRGTDLQRIMLKYQGFFDINSREQGAVVRQVLKRDKQKPIEDRVNRLWQLAHPVLRRLRFSSTLDLIAEAVRE